MDKSNVDICNKTVFTESNQIFKEKLVKAKLDGLGSTKHQEIIHVHLSTTDMEKSQSSSE